MDRPDASSSASTTTYFASYMSGEYFQAYLSFIAEAERHLGGESSHPPGAWVLLFMSYIFIILHLASFLRQSPMMSNVMLDEFVGLAS